MKMDKLKDSMIEEINKTKSLKELSISLDKYADEVKELYINGVYGDLINKIKAKSHGLDKYDFNSLAEVIKEIKKAQHRFKLDDSKTQPYGIGNKAFIKLVSDEKLVTKLMPLMTWDNKEVQSYMKQLNKDKQKEYLATRAKIEKVFPLPKKIKEAIDEVDKKVN